MAAFGAIPALGGVAGAGARGATERHRLRTMPSATMANANAYSDCVYTACDATARTIDEQEDG